MGMDVYGRKPTAPAGEYFRRSMWGWRPIADYVIEMHPDIGVTERCSEDSWHSNDGRGLQAERAADLARAIVNDVQTGAADAYVEARDKRLASLSRTMCPHCGGTGSRSDEVGVKHGMHVRQITEPADHPRLGKFGWCNGCNGYGTQPHWETHYSLDVRDLEEFATFVAASGGFKIC